MHNGFSDATLLDLVEHIYAAGCDPGGWHRFADRVNREVPGVGCAVGCFLVTKGERFIQHFAHAGYNPDSIKSLLKHYQEVNPYEEIELADPDGPWIIVDATPRIRYGNIYENARIATLPPSGEFLRVGYKVAVNVGFGGDDFLSRFGWSLSYLYFDNIRGGHGISDFEKADATLSYKITDNIGLALSYTRGRNEDQLKLVDQIVAPLTFKLGERPGAK